MKSIASDLLPVLHEIYKDSCSKCSAPYDIRDWETIQSRCRHEGLSFLTITLPQFGRDFERSLAAEKVCPSIFRAFGKIGSIPKFLQGMIGLVFNSRTGDILNDEFSAEAIECVRQIAYTFKKLEVACTSERDAGQVAVFIEDERRLHSEQVDPDHFTEFSKVSRVLWDSCLADISVNQLVPKHGPGSTADRLSPNGKYRLKEWHRRLEGYFPFFSYVLSENAMDSEEFQQVIDVPEDEERPVKVVLVPKDSRGSRIIAMEPACNQYCQQAISGALVDALESSRITRGHVNFRDQSVNQLLARTASETGQLATLDLSCASDNVPYALAITMFDGHPDLKGAVDACRSRRAELPNGDVLPLAKFASMGSALCFPVESMYFYTLCVLSLLKERNLQPTYDNCFKVSRSVFVYGDDIIVPSASAESVIAILQRYKCRVNTNKSFWTGKFRESCGQDAWRGRDVTPTYIRQTRPHNCRSASEVVSWVAAANAFYRKGFWRTTSLLRNVVERALGIALPYVQETSPGLGWHTFQGWETIGNRWDSHLHMSKVQTYVAGQIGRAHV